MSYQKSKFVYVWITSSEDMKNTILCSRASMNALWSHSIFKWDKVKVYCHFWSILLLQKIESPQVTLGLVFWLLSKHLYRYEKKLRCIFRLFSFFENTCFVCMFMGNGPVNPRPPKGVVVATPLDFSKPLFLQPKVAKWLYVIYTNPIMDLFTKMNRIFGVPYGVGESWKLSVEGRDGETPWFLFCL